MSDTPSSITGGCLCEAIRYKITFPPNHDFATAPSTCQCSQCRKQTGSLIFRVHHVPKSAVTYTSGAPKQYHASPGNSRAFCGDCGSLLSWSSDAGDGVSVCVGTFDADALRKHGRVLTDARRHLFCSEEIAGVTDHLQGDKWVGDNDGPDATKM